MVEYSTRARGKRGGGFETFVNFGLGRTVTEMQAFFVFPAVCILKTALSDLICEGCRGPKKNF